MLRLAARSVGRNARRSLLTAAAMVIGLALLIFSRSLSEGSHEQWIESAVRMGTGHVAIQAPDFLETLKLDHRLEAEAVERSIRAVEELAATESVEWTARLAVNGLASSSASALPVRVEGVDPLREAAFTDLDDKLQEGRYLQPDDRLHAYVGVAFARRLDLEVGDRFVVTAQSATGEVEGQLLRVAGTYRTGIQEVDEGLVQVPIETAREWLHTPGAITTLAVVFESSRVTGRALRALDETLGGDGDIEVLGWREASPLLDSAIRLDDYGGYMFHTILFAIIALAILNAVLMSVLGRRREFGILQAMGLTGWETGFVVFGEGMFLTAASGVVGMAVGLAVTWLFFRDGLDFSVFMEGGMSSAGGVVDPVILPKFYSGDVRLSVYFILVIGTLASLYPALRASRMDPAEAMKFDR
jgi:ABC-type lipoprotein release transport system permease subunit